jgi:hypothetical protein
VNLPLAWCGQLEPEWSGSDCRLVT